MQDKFIFISNRKLRSNLHNIESLIAFIDLHDKIYIKETFGKNHKIKFMENLKKTYK